MSPPADPDEILAELKQRLAGFGTRIAYLFEQLDAHLSAGGRLPRAWRESALRSVVPHSAVPHGTLLHVHEHAGPPHVPSPDEDGLL